MNTIQFFTKFKIVITFFFKFFEEKAKKTHEKYNSFAQSFTRFSDDFNSVGIQIEYALEWDAWKTLELFSWFSAVVHFRMYIQTLLHV